MTAPIDRLHRLLEDLPAQIARAQQRAAELAERTFPAAAADQSVVAVADGTGRLVELQLTAAAARQLDNYALSERIAEAVNGALDAVDAARAELVAEESGTADLDAAMQRFDQRMAALEATLDSIESRFRP